MNHQILIVKDAQRNTVDVYTATPEQVKSFYESDMHVAVMGWPVATPDQLAGTSLTREEMAELHNRHHSMDARFKVGERSKRDIARMIFDGLPKIAKPYDITPSKSDYYPAPEKTPAPKQTTKKTSRKGPWETMPLELKPQRADGCTARLIDVLRYGATLEQLKAAVPKWREETVLSALHTDVRTKAGYGVKKEMVGDEFVYRLVYPQGVTEPLPHIVKK
jgi:hypothetical protein